MGFQWFPIPWIDGSSEEESQAGMADAAETLNAWLDDTMKAEGVTAAETIVFGFSQGTMMSLGVAPFFEKTLAGVLGYSGALLWDEQKAQAGMHNIPVRLIHGEADDVVPLEAYHMARQKLEEQGFDVSGHTTPGLPHSIDGKGVESGAEFLKSIL